MPGAPKYTFSLIAKLLLVMAFLVAGSLRIEWVPSTAQTPVLQQWFSHRPPFTVQVALRVQWPPAGTEAFAKTNPDFWAVTQWLVTRGLWQRLGELFYVGPYQPEKH
ncbi:MAG: hypothetical protein VKJ06_04440 [Vampirovibrionales bacterium]|nr:hypothetical protein [Vampirovibrionales bacterium]